MRNKQCRQGRVHRLDLLNTLSQQPKVIQEEEHQEKVDFVLSFCWIFFFRRTRWMVVSMSSLISAPIVAFKSGKRYFLKNRQIFLWGGLIFQETHVKEAVWATSFPIGSNSSTLHKILWGAWGQKEPGNLDEDEYCSVLIYFHLPGDLFCGFWAKPETCRTSAGSRRKLRHLRNQGSH